MLSSYANVKTDFLTKGVVVSNQVTRTVFLLTLVSLAFFLASCGGSGETSEEPAIPSPPPKSSITLEWVAPAIRMDGKPLLSSELVGYKIYMGRSKSDLSLIATLDDPSIFTYEVNELMKGTYYFAISAYSDDELESELSTILQKEL